LYGFSINVEYDHQILGSAAGIILVSQSFYNSDLSMMFGTRDIQVCIFEPCDWVYFQALPICDCHGCPVKNVIVDKLFEE
jgi:hypothetical protein